MTNSSAEHVTPKTHKLFSGTIYNLSSHLLAGMFRFGSTAVAAHYLNPSDFGVFGLAYVLIGLMALFKAYGVSAFLIHKNECDESYYHTAFWVNIATGLMLFVLTLCLSPLFAFFYKSNVLQGVVSIIAIDFFVSELSSINSIRLQQQLKFHLLSLVEIIRSFSQSIIVIILSVCGYGVWSLAYAVIAASLIATSLLYYTERWHPKFRFSWAKFAEIFKFGRNILGESFCNYISQNLDYLIIGRVLGTSSLGIYKLAYGLPHLIYENFPQKVTPVLYPFLCQIRSNINEYKNTFIRSVSLVANFAFPALTFLGFNAHDIVVLLYGEKWLSMISLVQIFVVLAMARCVGTFVGSILNSLGRPDLGFKINILKLPIFALGIYSATMFWGLVGVCIILTCIETFSVIAVYAFLSKKFLEAPEFGKMVSGTSRALLLAIAPILIVFILAYSGIEIRKDSLIWVRLIKLGLIWVGSWFSLYLLLWRQDLIALYKLGVSFCQKPIS